MNPLVLGTSGGPVREVEGGTDDLVRLDTLFAEPTVVEHGGRVVEVGVGDEGLHQTW